MSVVIDRSNARPPYQERPGYRDIVIRTRSACSVNSRGRGPVSKVIYAGYSIVVTVLKDPGCTILGFGRVTYNKDWHDHFRAHNNNSMMRWEKK